MRTDAAFTTNWSLSLSFIGHAQEIAGRELVQVAPLEDDLRRATDLLVCEGGDLRYAVRVRRKGQLRYRDEFTLRSYNRGSRTEIHKIIEDGWGDRIIYGFEGEGGRMSHWFMGDLDLFRAWTMRNQLPPDVDNRDGTMFKAFRIADMPRRFVVDASWQAGPRQMELVS